MAWRDWVRTVEIEPSIYAADFTRLGDQIEALLDAGVRIFHFDVGDGHFVPPVTIGPIVLQSIAPDDPPDGRPDRLPSDGRRPCAPLRGDRRVRRRQRHVPRRGRGRRRRGRSRSSRARARGGRRLQPGNTGRGRARRRRTSAADLCLCMCIEPGYSGQEFLAGAYERIARARSSSTARPGGRRRRRRQRPQRCTRPARPARRGNGDLRARGSAARLPTAGTSTRMSLERALELAGAMRRQGAIRSRRSARWSSRTARSSARV